MTTIRLIVATVLLAVIAPASAHAALPDPLVRGPYTVTTMSVADPAHAGAPGDPGEAKLGLASLEEPNGTGGAVGTGTPNAAANAVQLQVRGSLYYPSNRSSASPLIVLVHGNHGSCNTAAGTGLGGQCAVYNRNDAGYAYLAANLASWGYVVFSLDQDQLIFYQDGSYGKGMHQRRLLIAAALDGLYQANQPGGLPNDTNDNVGTQLVGKIDFSRIGLMGHSRGGDAVASFLDYNRTRPAPGRRYAIRAVISLSPVDYERRAPYGVVYAAAEGACDGDVSNLQGSRLFERSLYIQPDDPFPRIQMVLHGANHDAFNTEWDADGDDSTSADPACGVNTATNPDSIRLGRGGNVMNGTAMGTAYNRTNFFSDDPALMGDQARAGLAMMSEFFRRYVGGETPFDDYMTDVNGTAARVGLPDERHGHAHGLRPAAADDVLRSPAGAAERDPAEPGPAADGLRAGHVADGQRLRRSVRELGRHGGADADRRRLRLVRPGAEPVHALAARHHADAARRRPSRARCRERTRSAARATARVRTRRSTAPTGCS